MVDIFNGDEVFGPQYPPPLPPTRTVELVRTQLDMVGRCASCVRSPGILTCARCCAVKYCSQDCQKRGSPLEGRMGWKDHKEICNKIQMLKNQVVAAGEALVQEFGGAETFLKTSLVKRGLFDYIDITAEIIGQPPIVPQNANERYILARQRLIETYVKCGEDSLSSVAFRLAAENMLDQLCLTYRKAEGEQVMYTHCAWMVAGGMNQEALNYLCYFYHRQLSASRLPYLDLSKDEDIEGDEYLEMLKPKNDVMVQWFHNYMLVALIKYKRLQSLLVQKQKDEAGWKMFMMGTHPEVGEMSSVLIIRGKNPVVEKIKGLVLNLDQRVNALTIQIQKILTEVNLKNPLLIPGIIDRNSIPEEPELPEEDDYDEDLLSDGHGDDIHDACWAFGIYGHAWNMSPAYTRVLQFFLDTGRVTSRGLMDGRCILPVEGLLQAACDVDPTRYYGQKDDLFIGWAAF